MVSVVQADEGDKDAETGMDVDVDAAESKQVYKPARLAPVYYGQWIYLFCWSTIT